MNKWNKILKDDKAFTGLEAAIVLVAFVVVAAVFSYVMLGAGFYTTQKSQEVVHTGVAQASSSVAIAGDVVIKGHATVDGNATDVIFYVTNTAGGSAVDLSKSMLSYADSNDFAANCSWTIDCILGDDDNMVEKGEKYQITAVLGSSSVSLPAVNEQIKLELKPSEGAVLVLQRTMPPEITAGDYYTVY